MRTEDINIKRIEFTDDTSITFEQAARRILKENKLAKGYYIKNGTRPATGVLEEWTRCGDKNCIEPLLCYTPRKKRRLTNIWFGVVLSATNDQGIVESGEEQCLRIAQWLRSFKRG